MNNKLVLIVDASNLLIRNMLTKFTKVNSNGVNITGVFGFLRSIFMYLREFYPNEIYIVWDIGRSIKHRKLYPQYKKQRDAKSDQTFLDNFRKQRKILIDLLKYFPFKEIILPKTEGDMIMAYIAKKEAQNNNKAIIISTDKDFYQLLLYDNILVFNPRKRKYIELYEIQKEFKINSIYLRPQVLPIIRSILGDTSDNIFGVKNLGIKFCEQLLNEVIKDKDFNNIDEFLQYIKEYVKMNNNKKSFIKKLKLLLEEDNQKILKINYELMNLIDIKDIDISTYVQRIDESDIKELRIDLIRNILSKLEINTILTSENVRILYQYLNNYQIKIDNKKDKFIKKNMDELLKEIKRLL